MAQDAPAYDEWCALPEQERIRASHEVSPEAAAEYAREPVERWLVANRYRLSDEQAGFVAEVVASIRPELFAPDRDEVVADAFVMGLYERATVLFPSREDRLHVLAAQGLPCVPEPSAYDRWGPLPVTERVALFSTLSSEGRAEVARTHVRRWLEVNRAWLRPAQVALLEELLGWISPALYEEGGDLAEAQQWFERVEEAFPAAEARQVFPSEGVTYIPPTRRAEAARP